jgi:hypothetical protein
MIPITLVQTLPLHDISHGLQQMTKNMVLFLKYWSVGNFIIGQGGE